MYDLIKYNNESLILLLSIFPLIGLAFEYILSRKQTLWVMGIASVLFLTIITPYHYTIPYAFRTLLLVILAAAFACCLKTVKKNRTKIWIAFIASAILFFLPTPFPYRDSPAAYRQVEKSWHVDNYRIDRIDYIWEHSFGSSPLKTYELSKYCVIPFVLKKVETVTDTSGSCYLEFAKSRIAFDKCNGTIMKKVPKP
jgi:hypothetical protein